MSRNIRLALVAFGLVLAAGALTVVLTVIVGSRTGGGLERVPAGRVADTMGSFGIGWGLDAQAMRVEEAEQDAVYVGSPSQWYRLSVRPENVGAYQGAVEAHFPEQAGGKGPVVVTGDAAERRMREVGRRLRRPGWWEPEKLPDAEPVAVEGANRHDLLVFSEKTGTIYLFVQGR